MTAATPGPLLEVRGLRHEYPLRRGLWQRPNGTVRAVDDVSFELWPGETLGLVGESGCGKTTLGKAVVRLLEPTAGEIVLRLGEHGKRYAYQVLDLAPRPLRQLRRHMQIVFQNPYAALNPRLTIRASLDEALRAGPGSSRSERYARIVGLLRRVGLDGDAADRYPHVFSGGQLQRISIARALACEPSFVVCDEVVSALDVSVQAQTVNLLTDLQRERKVAYLFISHDLKVVAQMSRRVAVMYRGQFVETGRAADVFAEPRHPYTRALLAAVPGAASSNKRADPTAITSESPGARERLSSSDGAPHRGCRYRARCPEAIAECAVEEPPLVQIGGGHEVRCHLCKPEATPRTSAPADPRS